MVSSSTPRETVAELDRYIIGQHQAKRAVAIARRNRWRWQQLPPHVREEVFPKNILMIGPTGVGKTEIARRLARMEDAPFHKVEATKFTEIGYVGRDVDQMIRDMIEREIVQTRERARKSIASKAEAFVEKRLLDILVGEESSPETREKFAQKLQSSELNDKEIDIQISESANTGMPTFDIPGIPGAQMGMINLGEIFGKNFGSSKKTKRLTVENARAILLAEESDKLIEQEKIVQEAIKNVEENGIVFIDEIDKICARSDRSGGDVSREGVQRDLLPLIEGTTVSTKYGPIQTHHILFIGSGAFHLAKPSDLLPELQGRLPIRVELQALTEQDFVRILTETELSLIKQYEALLKIDGITLNFTQTGIETIARLAAQVNNTVENIGARRLHTVMERLLEEISFSAPDRNGETLTIDEAYVVDKVASLAQNIDLSKFIL